MLACFAWLGIPVQNQAAPQRIVWVSFHPADGTPSTAAAGAGFTQAPDVEYTRLLRAAGHEVTRYITTATPDTNLLNGFDLVIISRSVASANYQTDPSPARWNGITKPSIILGGYVLRASRLGFTTGETMVDTTAAVRLATTQAAHPIFTGISLDGNGLMVNTYADRVTYNGLLQAGISVNTDAPTAGADVIATIGTDTDPAFGGMMIAEFPVGTVMSDVTADTLTAKRLVFLTGSREAGGITAEGSGIWDLSTDGARLFLNAVHYMTGQPVTEPPPIISNLRPSSGTREHLAELGLSFQAGSGTAGGIPTTNITLNLNGTNVSSDLLFISGTPQARVVSFSNLVANVTYTGIITVRDAASREAVLNFTFDTLPPLALPTSFSYPTTAASAAAPGMRARIVQATSTPTLPNTADRAEAQLDGTLIDAATGQPFVNEATPSTDNPDGSYNLGILNWSVEFGQALERGNFVDPAFPDQPIPGLAHNNNVAVEVLAYLELPVGRYYMGVNSDDGFVVSTGLDGRDLFAQDLGRFDGARGSTDSIFQFRVTEAGLYPFRLLYYQGDGGGNLEWFTMNPLTGEKILINDRANAAAVKAWRQLTVPERPYLTSLNPAPGANNVEVDSPIIATIQNGGSTVQSAVQMTLNGQSVAPQVTQAAGVTTVRYVPALNLSSDTEYTVNLTYSDSASNQRTVTYDFTTEFVPPTATNGAKIVWISFHNADNEPSAAAAGVGFTNAPDIGYTDLLKTAGHTVTRYLTTATPDVDFLNTFDLVIVSRSVGSANFQTPESTALWHSITKPTIQLGGYLIRAVRLGFTTGDTIPDTAGTIGLKVNVPTHPIFQGIQLDAQTNTVNTFAHIVTLNGAAQRGISVNSNPVVPGGTVLATVNRPGDPANGGMVIGEYPAGTTMGNPSADVTAGKRLIFLTGCRERDGVTGDSAGMFDLEGDGPRLFLNAVNYMAGVTNNPGPANVTISAQLSANQLVISWPEAGSTGFNLQGTDSLSPANWQAVPGTPTSANGQLSMTVPTSGSGRFFRLTRP